MYLNKGFYFEFGIRWKIRYKRVVYEDENVSFINDIMIRVYGFIDIVVKWVC